MGQAKRRGSRDNRIAEALGLKQRTLEDVRRELGMPDSAEFLGYVVHIPATDEFLHSVKDAGGAVTRSFARTPDLAFPFESFGEAFALARQEKGEIVAGLFDVGDQFYVAGIT